jgi:peptidoglycan hydrolase-like protein with peptidoglycan-binding domain
MNKQFGAGLAIDGIFGAKSKAAWRNIKQGMSGNITKAIQGFLICYRFDTNGFDGQFGSGTANAVRKYQVSRGLSADAVVGKVTISKITE